MDLKETEARDDYAGEDQQQSNPPTDRLAFKGLIFPLVHGLQHNYSNRFA
jgi:hypothetical protein